MKIQKLIVNNKGFSLVEAIVTVAIVGLIIVPISIIFTGSLKNSIMAREQLKANQLAQMYVEELKVMSDEEVAQFFIDSGNGTIAGSLTHGLPSVPDGYTVDLNYQVDSYNTDSANGNYATDPYDVDFAENPYYSTSGTIDLPDYDFTIVVDHQISSNIIKVEEEDSTSHSLTIADKELCVYYYNDASGHEIKFKNKKNGTVLLTLGYSPSDYNFSIVGKSGSSGKISIKVFNETEEKLNVYVQNEDSSTAEADFSLIESEGEVTFYYNQDPNQSQYIKRIYQIEAIVYKDSDELARYQAAKVAE